MTFDDLHASVDYMRAQENDFLERLGWDDATITGKYEDAAKQDLLDDLQTALGLDPNDDTDMAEIDRLIDTHASRMERVLSILLLRYLYQNHYMGPAAEMNMEKWEHYQKQYNQARQGFAGLRTARGISPMRIVRTVK